MFRPIFAVLTLSAVLATACGATDAGDVEPAGYARSVCSGLIGWRDGVVAASAALSHSLAGAAGVATADPGTRPSSPPPSGVRTS